MCGTDIHAKRADALVCGPNCGWRYKHVIAILKRADGGRDGCLDDYTRRSAHRRARLRSI